MFCLVVFLLHKKKVFQTEPTENKWCILGKESWGLAISMKANSLLLLFFTLYFCDFTISSNNASLFVLIYHLGINGSLGV